MLSSNRSTSNYQQFDSYLDSALIDLDSDFENHMTGLCSSFDLAVDLDLDLSLEDFGVVLDYSIAILGH